MNYKSREKKAFIENKSLHGLKTAELARKLGVSNSTVRKWKRAVGVDTERANVVRANHARRAMSEDRYLISAGGISKYKLPELCDMYAISTCTAAKILREMGIKPHGRPATHWSETQPSMSEEAKFVCQQMQAWRTTSMEAQ